MNDLFPRQKAALERHSQAMPSGRTRGLDYEGNPVFERVDDLFAGEYVEDTFARQQKSWLRQGGCSK